MSCFGVILGGFFGRPLMNLRDFSQKSARKFCKKEKFLNLFEKNYLLSISLFSRVLDLGGNENPSQNNAPKSVP